MFLNITTYALLPLLSGIVNMFKLKVLVSILGNDANGIYQFYVQFFLYFTIFELALESAVCSSLFHGLATKNYEEVNEIIKGSKKYANYLALANLVIGLGLLPFAPWLTGNVFPVLYIVIIQTLYTVRSTFNNLFEGPQAVTIADNHAYRVIILDTVNIIFQSLGAMAIVYFTRNLLYVVIFECLVTFIFVVFKTRYLKAQFPWLDWHKTKKSSFVFKDLFKATLTVKGTEFFITSSDLIIITPLLGAASTSLFSIYNNFAAIIVAILGTSLITTMQSFLGQKFIEHKEDKATRQQHIKMLEMLNALILIILVPMMSLAINAFIRLFYGEAFMIEGWFYFGYILFIYFRLFRTPYNTLKVSLGNSQRFTVISGIDAAVKISLAIILGKMYGLTGIIFSTTIAYLLTEFIYEIKIFDVELLEVSVGKRISEIVINFIITCILSFAVYRIFTSFITSFVSFILVCGVVFAALVVGITLLYYMFSKDFQKLWSRVK